jgi:glycosyltransferase involved in cell wall biosynthesis
LKRVDVALGALHRIIYDYGYPDVALHLAGEGPFRSKIALLANRLKVENHVVFHGFVRKPIPLMDQMNVVLLTSETGGLPRCLMEALSLGKTVVASDISGVNEIIKDGQTGYLFPVGDADRLASLIVDIIQNGTFLPSKRLVQFMLDRYDSEAACDRILMQIEDLYQTRDSTSVVT